MGQLVLLRHGQSEWNKRNLFTGWVDIPLSPEGIEESLSAGRKMADLNFDVIFTSTLVRAQTTLFLAMTKNKSGKIPCIIHEENQKLFDWATIHSDEAATGCIPVFVAWELNERMYGALQGMNKKEMMEQFGEEQVKIWRRSYKTAPPEGESLEMTTKRTLPYFHKRIVPYLEEGKNVLVSAHGNSIRGIIMFLENLSQDEVVSLEIPTGDPIIYKYRDGTFQKSVL